MMDYLFQYDLQFFAGKDGPGGEKTEPATERKLSKAREEGQVCKSKELNSAVGLLALFLTLKIAINYMGTTMISLFPIFYNKIPDTAREKEFNAGVIMSYFWEGAVASLKLLAPFFAVGFLVAILVNMIQVRWKISTKPLQPRLDKFNPINGFKRMFSKDALFELFLSILKIALIAYIAYTSIKDKENELFILYDITLNQAIAEVGSLVINVGLKISIVYCILGLTDYIYQRHKFNDDMKMTKQEIKDEMKDTEGDPKVKGKQRQRMQEASRRRMMQDVPKADVVITNPTHLAVAIQYEADQAKAPVVLAKGADYVAQKIKEIARENKVEIVENKPLARMLYANVEIGQEIPPELYQTVAEILARVYRTRNM